MLCFVPAPYEQAFVCRMTFRQRRLDGWRRRRGTGGYVLSAVIVRATSETFADS